MMVQSFFSILCLLKYANWKLYDKLNSSIVPNRKLCILGNGSSLTESLCNLNVDVDYMVLNRHVLHDSYTDIKPRYYVLADPFFFVEKEGLECMRKINECTNWEMTLFLPNNTSGVEKKLFSNNKIKIQRYNTQSFHGFNGLRYFFYRHNICMPIVQNVLVACIYIGICLKYKKIEIYGVEHSWTKYLFVGDDNVVYQYDPHFYDKQDIRPRPMQKSITHEPYKLHEILRDYAQMFDSYWDLKYFAKEMSGVHIVNKTNGSFIDAFEKS